MLYKKPMVISYVIASLSWHIMKRMAYLPWVGLPNILAQDFVVPELLQDEATPEALAQSVLHWFEDGEHALRVADRFDVLHRSLRCNTAEKASEAIAHVIQAR
jgi:lipid-A-disaccharide synthase